MRADYKLTAPDETGVSLTLNLTVGEARAVEASIVKGTPSPELTQLQGIIAYSIRIAEDTHGATSGVAEVPTVDPAP